MPPATLHLHQCMQSSPCAAYIANGRALTLVGHWLDDVHADQSACLLHCCRTGHRIQIS